MAWPLPDGTPTQHVDHLCAQCAQGAGGDGGDGAGSGAFAQSELAEHEDGTPWSFVVGLNELEQFDGGGTQFVKLDGQPVFRALPSARDPPLPQPPTAAPVFPTHHCCWLIDSSSPSFTGAPAGTATLFSGFNRHRGARTTRGVPQSSPPRWPPSSSVLRPPPSSLLLCPPSSVLPPPSSLLLHASTPLPSIAFHRLFTALSLSIIRFARWCLGAGVRYILAGFVEQTIADGDDTHEHH